MSVRQSRALPALCCAAHFAIDFACALLLLGLMDTGRPLRFLLYNFCAFALQMPLGLLADRSARPLRPAAAGCLLAAMAFPLRAAPAAAVLLAGTGNALYHVGAGLFTLRRGEKRCAPLGLFVSPGALGLFLGAALAARAKAIALLPPCLLLACALPLLLLQQSPRPPAAAPAPAGPVQAGSGSFWALCLFGVVFLRSLIPLSLPLPWKGTVYGGAGFACAAALGKALGGFGADRFGIKRAALWPLALSAPLLLFAASPLPGFFAVLLLNTSMPITLWAMARRLPGAEGFSFGMLSFALFLGFLPGFLHLIPALSPGAAAAGAAASLLLLGPALGKAP